MGKNDEEKEKLLNVVMMLKGQLSQQLSNNNELRDRLIQINKRETQEDEEVNLEDIEELNEENFKFLKEKLKNEENENLILNQQIEELKQVLEFMKKIPEPQKVKKTFKKNSTSFKKNYQNSRI